MKAHYVIFVEVPKGQGDYGSDRKCVFDSTTTRPEAEQLAQSMANLMRSRTELFKGKTLGKFCAEYLLDEKADLPNEAEQLQDWLAKSALARFNRPRPRRA